MSDEENAEHAADEAVAADPKPVELTEHEKKFLVACSAGNKVQIEHYTKEQGLSANLKSAKYGLQPLHLVCGAGAVDCAKILVEHGADIRAADPMGLTPLHWAAGCREPEMIRYLLSAGASDCLNAVDEDGSTPLIHAAYANRPGNVAALLEAGADQDVQDKSGNTAKKWAIEKKRGDVLNIFDPKEEGDGEHGLEETTPQPASVSEADPEPKHEAPTPESREGPPAGDKAPGAMAADGVAKSEGTEVAAAEGEAPRAEVQGVEDEAVAAEGGAAVAEGEAAAAEGEAPAAEGEAAAAEGEAPAAEGEAPTPTGDSEVPAQPTESEAS